MTDLQENLCRSRTSRFAPSQREQPEPSKPAECSLSTFKMFTAPQPERSDPPNMAWPPPAGLGAGVAGPAAEGGFDKLEAGVTSRGRLTMGLN